MYIVAYILLGSLVVLHTWIEAKTSCQILTEREEGQSHKKKDMAIQIVCQGFPQFQLFKIVNLNFKKRCFGVTVKFELYCIGE